MTERAVFRLEADGVHLVGVAPGVDVRRDVLERMGFPPRVRSEPAIMEAAHFRH